MFGFFRHNQQATEVAAASSQSNFVDVFRLIEGDESSFERLMGRAAQLRNLCCDRISELSSGEKVYFLCCVRDISMNMQRHHSIPPEALPFGSLETPSAEQTRCVIDELGGMFSDAEQNGNRLLSLAAAYCQSMAMLLLAATMTGNRDQELEFIGMKHLFSEQTGKLVDSLEPA